MVGSELFVAREAAIAVGEALANAVNHFADGAREPVDDVLR
jgi:hypothetical protein